MKNILVPRNLEGRKDKLYQYNIQLLGQKVIEGNLIIDRTFEGIPEELVKVKEIRGNVRLILYRGYIPSWLKTIKIYGYFDCAFNDLNSLENCPQYVGNKFRCSGNNLTSLEGCPKYIGNNLQCCLNAIRPLQLPKNVRLIGNFYN